MIKGGKGGARTITGLNFESKSDLRQAFTKFSEYSVSKGDLFYDDQMVANLFKKHDLYKMFLEPRKIDYKKIISKKLLPDDAIYVHTGNTLFIIEMKFQEVAGSVDEKLQTCDFKKKQYEKLLANTSVKVEYAYVLNDWFKDPTYRDVLEYIKSVNCHYFFETLPFSFLGLPEPKD